VQDAIDAADPLGEILVATGTYTDPAGTVASISYKTVTLKGGYDSTFSEATRDPNSNPTTLDAQGNGRVVYIEGDTSPTIDGFIITGGNADAAANYPRQGGGIYSEYAHPIIVNNIITNNIASAVDMGWGGGLFLNYASGSPIVSGNLILSNTASTADPGMGGGLYLSNSDATLSSNTINGNIASTAKDGYGGGLYLQSSDAALSGNTISGNEAGTAAGGAGGGLYLADSKATIEGNRIISNTAYSAGGGLYVHESAPFTLTNNIIAENEANGFAGGINVYGSSGVLTNNTIAQNNLGSGGQGVYAWGDTTLTLTNNIIVSHTYGIYASSAATVTADYTLFFGNGVDTWGPITSTHEVSGDPLFVDPSAWDYHIQSASPAINKGTFTGAPATDFEGDARPYDCFIDIGADENTASDYCKRIYLPLILKNY
jgi:parallel beta-helix repeat protein